MDKELASILKDSVKLAEMNKTLVKSASYKSKAAAVADELVSNGVMPLSKKAALIEKLSKPEQAYDMLIKLAKQVGPDSLGEASTKRDNETPGDKLLNWIIS